ncbi:MAG: RluA family pseudouridine synthase [Betaproteobacteria bacterium]|nr:RluA family pseudouridine synthase [Betaproteobacteria bacterium]
MNGLSKDSVNWMDIGPEVAGQRVDNFLLRILKGVPKSHIYRILRSGEVRVNSRRVEPTARLREGDRVRVPPVRAARPESRPAPPGRFPTLPIVFEDAGLLVVDKPAGLAVHGGSGVSHGVIEGLRASRPELPFLELVHRLDRETSGVLVLAKKRSVLTDLHAQLREGRTDKRYLALVKGRWGRGERRVDAPLAKYLLEGGDRRVRVDPQGQPAETVFRPVREVGAFSLVEARLLTGRTHQIRVHLAHLGMPICGDDKYGDFELNRDLVRAGLRRMFLHAARMRLRNPRTNEVLTLSAGLPDELTRCLEALGAPADPESEQRR